MPLQNRILDNRVATVADHLRRNLSGADALSLASAYFTIYGYELLAKELDQVGRVRFLFGDPTSVEDVDPGTNEPKAFELTKRGLGGSHQSNLEINLATDDADTITELNEWFDQLWRDDRLTMDVKQEVLHALACLGVDYAQEKVYYKTLYELFRKDIDARLFGDARQHFADLPDDRGPGGRFARKLGRGQHPQRDGGGAKGVQAMGNRPGHPWAAE